MAVQLTAKQADALAKDSSVKQLWKNHLLSVATPPTPKFLGLAGPGGVWQQAVRRPTTNAGDGIIIGDIDTGFWPESPSFAPLPEPRSDQAIIDAKWHGDLRPCRPATTTR